VVTYSSAWRTVSSGPFSAFGTGAAVLSVPRGPSDKAYITSTHRSHGHCIAKGNSMHSAAVDKGMLGANDIGTLAVAIGPITTVSTGYGAVTIAGRSQQNIGDILAGIGGSATTDAVMIGQADIGKQLTDSFVTMA
jgi:TPP-dependent pyruvate/acetoin dehydrogenase alpha subunit